MKLTMKRGDTRSFAFRLAKKFYSEGQTIHFTVKKEYDNDPTNSQALINKEFSDSDIISETDISMTYKIQLDPSDTENLEIPLRKSKSELKLIGELEVRQSDGKVKTFPSGKKFIEVVIYPDIKIGA